MPVVNTYTLPALRQIAHNIVTRIGALPGVTAAKLDLISEPVPAEESQSGARKQRERRDHSGVQSPASRRPSRTGAPGAAATAS